jgi:hypothetical protein
MIVLEACGHVPHRERGEEIIRLTTSFLERATLPMDAPSASRVD